MYVIQKAAITTDNFKIHLCVTGWYRADWEVLESVIGQVEEPFEVTLLYTSCLGEDGVTVALDSLELIDCESGECTLSCRGVLASIFF